MSETTVRLSLRDNTTGQGLVLTALALLAVGVVMVSSSLVSVGTSSAWYARADFRHIVFAALAATVVLVLWRVGYRWLNAGENFPWIAAILLGVALATTPLVFVPGLGRSVGGYYRWVRIGPEAYGIGFQPSELVKLTMVVFLAAWLTRPDREMDSFWRTVLPAAVVMGLCVGSVITQDLGTGTVIAVAACVTMLLAGVRWYYVAGIGVWGGVGFWAMLASSPSRWQRIEAMLDPWNEANPCAYQLRQSLTTIGTGGWWGKGLGQGMMKRGFLPEDSTDFLFATICEEWGFIGGAVLLGLVGVWLVLASHAARRAGDRFGAVLAGSLGFLIALQAAMHVAVNVGWMPPTGIGMPLVSAGGTRLVLMACAVALVVSVSSRRHSDKPYPSPAAELTAT